MVRKEVSERRARVTAEKLDGIGKKEKIWYVAILQSMKRERAFKRLKFAVEEIVVETAAKAKEDDAALDNWMDEVVDQEEV